MLTVKEAIEISGYHEGHLRRLLLAGEIEAQKFATVWQVNRASLESYLGKMAVKGEKRGPKNTEN